jgi:short subunit dehydrogenase-like uncharacterized protein
VEIVLTILSVIELCNLVPEELDVLAKKTTLLISGIGPYSIYGDHTFKACADNGTHYLDITGEVVWHAKMIKKYESTAKASGSIMIPQIGLDSAPADVVTWFVRFHPLKLFYIPVPFMKKTP